MKKLPIGISTLKKIIDGDFAYVDKTDIAHHLIENGGGYYFLSRPRRFGKSLFLDTLKSIFHGKKELFTDLAISKTAYDFKPHPVIKISFGSGSYRSVAALHQSIAEILNYNQQELGIQCDKSLSLGGCFKSLIYQASKHYHCNVVVLIDEYDKPILDNIDNTEMARTIREELKDFYSVIKDSDEYLRFVFITGVSKFSKVSLFSGLNNLEDITLGAKYSTLCGYTQHDIETVFAQHLAGQDFTKIKTWYNGYQWLGKTVYNPFGILLFISNHFAYRGYWFGTATPTFLLKLIEKNNYFLPRLEDITQSDQMLDSFDVDFINLEVLMWQTGYLTISSTQETPRGINYQLTIPNHEVRLALMAHVADFLSKIQNSNHLQNKVTHALYDKNLNALKTHISALFASIAYNHFTGVKLYEYEGYYVSVFYAYIQALGIHVISEDVTNKGRIDITINVPAIATYIIEFKVLNEHEKTGKALKQIKAKKYYEKYQNTTTAIYMVGIEFCKKERNICHFEWEEIPYP